MGKFTNSWNLLKQSWAILKQDKEIIWFPVLSLTLNALICVLILVPLLRLHPAGTQPNSSILILYAAAMFILYLLTSLVKAFFEAAIVSCAALRLNGHDPTFTDGLVKAKDRILKLVSWAFIDGSVRFFLVMLRGNQEKKKHYLLQYLGDLLEIAWSMVTFLVIPVLMFENLNVIDSIKKSAALFKKTWGEVAIATFSIGIIIFVLTLLLLIPEFIILALYHSFPVVVLLIAVTLVYIIILSSIVESLQAVYKAALYLYAASGKIVEGFDPELITGAFRKK